MTSAASPTAHIPAVSPMLRRLGEERATGALIRESGTLYLVDGQVVHAESPVTPGIDVLLTAGGTLAEAGWWEAVAAAGARQRVAAYLVDSGRVPGGALELCHLGALYDAAFFALAPASTPARFRYGVSHWIGAVHPVAAGSVERETLRRRELLDRIWPDATVDSAPLLRLTDTAELPLTPRRRAVLEAVDGTSTAADIARALGRSAFHTLVDVRRLAAAGALDAVRSYDRPGHASSGPRVGAPVLPEVTPDPDIALLRRLRDALEVL
ncbi:transcriptional regulator [Streptomyces sp. BBFR102]|uniref:transcriptional regulator n=1 Tax=Streptomyces sp. BBFR102 TaxID=3448171 RepID=UPI003F5331C7